MDGISERDVAERAGVDHDFVARLVDVGVLAPAADGAFTEGDVRRTRLYQGLERTGLPLEAIGRGAGMLASSRSGGSTRRCTT